MRIVAGEYGGRRLSAVPGRATRPTTDKVKEALFKIIGPYFNGGTSLDLFAGSGGLSIEAVSRGVDKAFLVDRQYAAVKTIRQNIAVTKHPEKFEVLKNDANRALQLFAKQRQHFDMVFLDPPYAKQQIVKNMQTMSEQALLNEGALIIAETDHHANLPDQLPSFRLQRRQTYGITELTLYRFGGGKK